MNLSKVFIHKLESKDWAIFQNLRLEALSLHPESFGSSLKEESALSLDEFRQRFTNCDLFGAFAGDALVGCAGFYIYPNLNMSHRGCIFSMYLKPSYRKQGIAHQLVHTIIEQAKEHVIQIHLTVVTSNLSAIKLYERHGFYIYGTEPRSLKIGHQFYDEHFMVLKLSSLNTH